MSIQTKLRQVMDQSFVLLRAEWTAEKAIMFLRGLQERTVVIARGSTYYYIYSYREAMAFLTGTSPTTTLHQALDLHEYKAVPKLDADSDANNAPNVAVVLERRRVVGVVDARQLPAVVGEPVRAITGKEQPLQEGRSFSAFPALSMPDTVRAETLFDIFVGFRETPDPMVQDSGQIRIDKPDSGKDCLVALTADGITLDRDYDLVPLRVNALVRFSGKLKPGVTEASVKALFIFDQQVIGTARRDLKAEGAASLGNASGVLPANPCRASLTVPEAAVDITVSLNLLRDSTLEWRLLAPAYPGNITKTKFQTTLPDTKEFAGDLMRDLRTQQFRGAYARNILETHGQFVTTLVPPEFFDVLQTVHAKVGRIPTLLLLTNETYVPWELAWLAKPLDAAAPPFLGAQTHMGRWLDDMNVMLPPSVGLEVKRMTAVASEYGLDAGQPKLVAAMDEQRALKDDWGAVPLQATRGEMEAMVTGTKIPGHLVHFAVHGYSDPAANAQALLLADRTELPASAMAGAYTCGDIPRFSFVFINACQVGTPGRTLGHASGFPGVLVRAGTLGFVAPLWNITDEIACTLAKDFYREAFKDHTSVGAILHARRCSYHDDTTPLAYIYYGHPGLRISRSA